MRSVLAAGNVLVLSFVLIGCGGGGGGDPLNPGPDVAALVAQGKTALIAGDGVAAENSFDQAVAAQGNNADANFGLALIALLKEANRLATFLSPANAALFPRVGTALPSRMAGLSLDDLFNNDLFGDAGAELELTPKDLAAFQTELVAMNGRLDTIRVHMSRAVDVVPDTWTFEVPQDWLDPAAGTVLLSRGDAFLLRGAVNGLQVWLHLSTAYSPGTLGVQESEFGELEITGVPASAGEEPTDTNSDGFVDLHEIAAWAQWPADWGRLNSGGRGRLEAATARERDMLADVQRGIDSWLAAGRVPDHWGFQIEADEYSLWLARWNSYGRDYLTDLINAHSGPVTLSLRPGLFSEFPELSDDPDSGRSIRVDLRLWARFPDDLRDFPLRWQVDEFGGLQLPEDPRVAITDGSYLGLFPDGIPDDLIDRLMED